MFALRPLKWSQYQRTISGLSEIIFSDYFFVFFISRQVRLSQETEHFFAIPNGLLYSEVTAGNLAKVDMGGSLVDPGSTGLGVNQALFGVHAAVHSTRPDIRCLIQMRNTSATSVSTE